MLVRPDQGTGRGLPGLAAFVRPDDGLYGPLGLDDHVALISDSGPPYYYLQDRLGNVAALTDGSIGTVVDRHHYEP